MTEKTCAGEPRSGGGPSADPPPAPPTDPAADRYNYEHFRISQFQWDPMPGPRPGERLEDLALSRLDGGELRLSELAGRPVVIEMGSYTCPQFVANVDRMNELRRRFSDVEFLALYTREAHPGERIGPHRHQAEKRILAQRLREESGDRRTYLVDDLEGRANLALGGMPNALYVLDGSRRVVYRALFAWAPDVTRVLEEMAAPQARPVPREGYGFVPAVRHLLPVFLRGGWRAVWDFTASMPGTIRFHLRMMAVQREWRRQEKGRAGMVPELAVD